MVRVFISDIIKKDENSRVGLPDTAKLIYDRLPKTMKARVDNAKNENIKLSRISVYGLLREALFRMYGIRAFELSTNQYGKPYLCDSPLKINLSHTDGICVAAISDGEEIGVDVEGKIDGARECRLKSRFFSEVNLDDVKQIDGIEYFLFGYTPDGELCEAKSNFNVTPGFSEKMDFTRLWTLSEAIMKCDGRGFSALSEIVKIKDTTEVSTVEISNEDKLYSISVVVKKAR